MIKQLYTGIHWKFSRIYFLVDSVACISVCDDAKFLRSKNVAGYFDCPIWYAVICALLLFAVIPIIHSWQISINGNNHKEIRIAGKGHISVI